MTMSADHNDNNIIITSKAPKLPWKFRILLFIHSLASNICRRSNITVNRRLMNIFDPKISPSSKPRHGVFTIDTIIDPSRNLWFRLFVPSSSSSSSSSSFSLPVVIYFHGGGFVFFSANSMPYDDLCRRLARDLRVIVISVNYRLSPEYRYPCPYEDGFDALKFIDQNDGDNNYYNADFSNCFIAGDSAGGNIAHHVAVRAGEYGNELKKVKIKGLIAIQPFFGGEERTESEIRMGESPMLNLEQADWYWKAFLPKGCDRNHVAANVFGGGGGEISGVKFPATLLIIGGRDQLRDWGEKYYEWLKKEGKEVEKIEYGKAIHGFYAVPELEDASFFIQDLHSFIHEYSTLSYIGS